MPRRPLTEAERLESKKRKQECKRKYAKSEKGKALNLKNKKKHRSIPEYREHMNRLRRIAYQAKKSQLRIDEVSTECKQPKLDVKMFNVTECRNRWSNSFPGFIPRTIMSSMTVDFSESIYDIPENTSNNKSSSDSVLLRNSDWHPGSAEGRQDVAKPSSTSNDVSNRNSPVIKIEVGIEEGSENDALHPAADKKNCCDYGYIIPISLCEVVTDIQQSRIQKCRTPEFDCGMPNERRETGTEFESSDSSGEHPIEMFFKSMGATVKTFPPHLVAIAKLKVTNAIADLELQAVAEMSVNNAAFCSNNGSGASK
ncbi:major centromere autoantigen B [Caerostris extrusa]|uniref:Major centromere autoantigen B n=1 Tax=Caerostris extrusa TaxID=172846 RepID=A0AAV4UIF9_CAEEX|nr:major centromere autoantigen B [Caerostris extrusa]